jgi:hypothetical protein
LDGSQDRVEKRKFLTLPGLELRPLGHPPRCQSLCQLRYPDFNGGGVVVVFFFFFFFFFFCFFFFLKVTKV